MAKLTVIRPLTFDPEVKGSTLLKTFDQMKTQSNRLFTLDETRFRENRILYVITRQGHRMAISLNCSSPPLLVNMHMHYRQLALSSDLTGRRLEQFRPVLLQTANAFVEQYNRLQSHHNQ